MFKTRCPIDGTIYDVEENQIGKTIRCQNCGSILKIPAPRPAATEMKHCANCGKQMVAGRVYCSECSKKQPSLLDHPEAPSQHTGSARAGSCAPRNREQELVDSQTQMSNFEFLRSYDVEAFKLAEKAESQFPEEPNEAAVTVRSLGERIAKSIAQIRGIDGNATRNQMDLLGILERADAIPRDTLDQFHAVRKLGNKGAHEHCCTAAHAEQALRAAYHLSTWFFHEFVDPAFKPSPFVLPGSQQNCPRPTPRPIERESMGDPSRTSSQGTRRHNGSSDARFDPTAPLHTTLRSLCDRNLRAQDVIEGYARRHATLDVAVGLVGLIPGMAIPALVLAIVAQGRIVYRPMARDLAEVYVSDLDKSTANIASRGMIDTAMLDIASEFGTEFIMEIGHEIVMEAGLGVLGSLCVPVLGGFLGAALDYLIANTMTWRVGTMVSMYFQNGSTWVDSRQKTYERATQLTGGIGHSVVEILRAKEERKTARVDLSEIPSQVPEIEESQMRALKPLIQMMRPAMGRQQIQQALAGQGIPAPTIEKALARYC